MGDLYHISQNRSSLGSSTYDDDISRLIAIHVWSLNVANSRDQLIQPFCDLLRRPTKTR
jgi:hypothetical protein